MTPDESSANRSYSTCKIYPYVWFYAPYKAANKRNVSIYTYKTQTDKVQDRRLYAARQRYPIVIKLRLYVAYMNLYCMFFRGPIFKSLGSNPGSPALLTYRER